MQNNPKFFYGWLVAVSCCLIAMTGAPQLTYGIYVKELAQEFHWSRALISSFSSVNKRIWLEQNAYIFSGSV